MCGITGFFSVDNSDVFASEEQLKRMTDAVAHRGPDAAGYYTSPGVGLGHRRLSILDLSSGANQPFFSKDGRYVMVFNGEVFNYREIATSLNIETRTSSDTEVILEAFVLLGPDFVNLCNGMFALAIYDKQQHELHLFRDRLGVKPLVYYWDGKNFAFASEIKSLLTIPHIKQTASINIEAIALYLHLNFIPDPLSAYSNIHKMESGGYYKVGAGGLQKSLYWSIEQKITKEIRTDEHAVLKEVEELLSSSVQYRLISDVPVGTFLSGGVDSSLVTALAQKYSSKPVKTFSIGFKEAKFNESEYAKQVAKHLHTDHHEFILSEAEALDFAEMLPDIYDEPFADVSAIPTLLVSKVARQQVTVSLTGDGGDELFGGYNRYKWAERLQNPLVWALRKPLSKVLGISERYQSAALLLNCPDKERLVDHVHSQESNAFALSDACRLLKINTPKWSSRFSNNDRTFGAFEQQSLFDLRYYLRDDLLHKVDIATMNFALEARVPFLDYRLVEYMLNVDVALKVKNGQPKYLLRKILQNYIPQHLIDRPKWGFTAPMKTWLQGKLNYQIDCYLSKESIESTGVLSYELVEKWVCNFKQNPNDYQRIWTLISLQRWLLKQS